MGLKLTTPPTLDAVSLTLAKQHLRVVDNDEDTLIGALRDAAVAHTESFIARALVDQTWQLTLDAFPTWEIKIPLPPLIEVISVGYDDAAGMAQILAPTSYTVDDRGEFGWIVPNSVWPATRDAINAVRVIFRAGYVNTGVSPPTGEVPPDIVAAILLHLGTLHAHRETIVIGQTAVQLPWAAEQLLRPYRMHLAMA
jgi:uncharacterized phiE125 gp8 family phage protein